MIEAGCNDQEVFRRCICRWVWMYISKTCRFKEALIYLERSLCCYKTCIGGPFVHLAVRFLSPRFEMEKVWLRSPRSSKHWRNDVFASYWSVVHCTQERLHIPTRWQRMVQEAFLVGRYQICRWIGDLIFPTPDDIFATVDRSHKIVLVSFDKEHTVNSAESTSNKK